MRFQSGFWLGLHSSEGLIGTGEAAFKASATFLIIIPYILKILKNHFGLSIFLAWDAVSSSCFQFQKLDISQLSPIS